MTVGKSTRRKKEIFDRVAWPCSVLAELTTPALSDVSFFMEENMVGKLIHILEDGKIRYQGEIVSDEGNAYKVMLFSFMTGHPNGTEIFDKSVEHRIYERDQDFHRALFKEMQEDGHLRGTVEENVRWQMKGRERVYLSGAITNKPDYEADFALAAKRFPNCFNPCTVVADSYEDYMRRDIAELLKCDAIYFVNDITNSRGAQLEKAVAAACGIWEVTA